MALDIKNINLDSILKLPFSRKLMLLGGIYLFIAAIYGYMFYYPKMTQAKELKTKVEDLQRQVDNERLTASQLPKIKKEREEFKVQLEQALTQMPNEKEIPNLLSSISSSASNSGLDILFFKPLNEVPKTFYAEVPVDMKVKGGYDSLFMFFDKVAKLERIVNVSKLNVGDVKEEKGSVVITSSFVATTFRFMGEEEVKKLEEKDKKKK